MNGLLEDDGKTGSWDMGNGNGREAQRPVPTQLMAGSTPPDKDFVPPPSAYRLTATPTPAATHGGGAAVALLEPMEKLSKEFPAEFDENFPNDLKKCFEILKAVDALPVYLAGEDENQISKGSRRRRDEQSRRRKLIGAHIIELQNGTKPPEIDAHAIAELQQAERNRPAVRAARIQLLGATGVMIAELIQPLPKRVQLGHTDTPDAESAHRMLAVDPKDRLTLHPDVRNLLNIARVQAMSAELFSLENFDLCFPVEHRQELEFELRNCKDPERIRSLRSEIAALQETPEYRNRSAEINMKGQAEAKWQPVFKTLELLKSVAAEIVLDWEQDAIASERGYFMGIGLQHETTSVSRRYRSLVNEIEKLTISKTTFGWFGINDVAEI